MAELFELLPYVLATLMVVGVWALGLARLDVFTGADVRAWKRLAGMRGFASPAGRLERVAAKLPPLRRLQEELDLHRLLAVAGWAESPLGFLLRSLLISLLAGALFFGLLLLSLVQNGSWAIPPGTALLVGAMVFLIQLLMLRRQAEVRRTQAGRALGDMMMLVAILTDGRGLQLEDAVRLLSRCVESRSLAEIADLRGWQRLVHQPHQTTIELYRLIAAEYRIPLFAVVADAAANANVGFSEREIYSRVAASVYADRLAESRFRAARAKTLVTIPVAGMLLPLLVLIGAPVFAAISAGLGIGGAP
ncbi:MAG TPA: hypothetical protein VEK76_07745 [Candidatus Binatia bacterium]|nr:hypothetical protein [Candidatus Binatia bacterium]